MAILTPLLLLLKNAKRSAITPGLVSSIALSVSFIAFRKLRPLCEYFPTETNDGCTFEWREVEMFTFFMCFMVIKNRSAVSLQQMINTSLMYSKLVNIVLFFRVSAFGGILYSILCLLRLWLFPENFVDGPEEITYFSDKTLEETLSENDEVFWLVEFYTTWSPPCRAVMPAFAALSNEYANDYLRFGKIDVGKYPDAAMKYGVNASTMSRQLPTIIHFEKGKAVNWRPMIGSNKKFIKYVFSEENMKRDFDLNKLYEDASKKCKKTKKSSKKEN